MLAALAATLVATAAALTRLTPLRPSPSPAAPTAESQPNLHLSKEYVYAGSRLVATEEPAAPTPTPAPAGPAPTGLVATATSPTSVALTWAAPAVAVISYRVERSPGAGGAFTALSPDPTGPAFNDTTANAGTAYLYRVHAVYAAGPSTYSNTDLATTIVFEDDPLVSAADDPTGQTVTKMRERHVTQLREAVNAVRAAAGLPAAGWSTGAQAGMLIRAVHFEELRAALGPALAALGLPPLPGDPSLAPGLPVRAAHIRDLRTRVK